MSVLERMADVSHKLITTGLFTMTLGGLGFIGLGLADSIQRRMLNQKTPEEKAQE